jgi:hypothetical protein
MRNDVKLNPAQPILTNDNLVADAAGTEGSLSLSLNVVPQTQRGNSCGTTCLAMSLSKILGTRVTQNDIDAEVRLLDTFTSAQNIVSSARSHGVSASMLNHLTQKEVINAIEHGRPIIFLSDLTSSGTDIALHWRVIDGFSWNEEGELLLNIKDPWGTSYPQTWSHLSTQWSNIRAAGLNSGYNRFGIVLGKDTTDRHLPVDRTQDIAATNAMSDAAQDLANVTAQISQGRLDYVIAGIVSIFKFLFALSVMWPIQFISSLVSSTPSEGMDAVAPTKEPENMLASAPTPKVHWFNPASKKDLAKRSLRAPINIPTAKAFAPVNNNRKV